MADELGLLDQVNGMRGIPWYCPLIWIVYIHPCMVVVHFYSLLGCIRIMVFHVQLFNVALTSLVSVLWYCLVEIGQL